MFFIFIFLFVFQAEKNADRLKEDFKPPAIFSAGYQLSKC